jgi:hypothetical protein
MLFITDTDAAWETSEEWCAMAWQQVCRLTENIQRQAPDGYVPGLDGEGSLPNLRDVDLMLMGQ